LHPGRGTTISGNGAWSISAHELAPAFSASGTPPTVQAGTIRRTFAPWTARLVIAQDLTRGWSLRAHAEHQRTAFYSVSAGAIVIDYRFSSAAARRVDRF
jgi:hypothetical protein